MLNKSLIQFSVHGWGCVRSLLFDLGPNYGGGHVDNGDLLPKVPCMHCYTQCSQPCSRPPPTHASPETPGHSRASLGQSLVGSLLLSPGSWCTQLLFVPSKSLFPVLCKFWRLYGGVNGDLLQVFCIQSPCPHSSPLLTCTSTEDTQTQFWLSPCGVSGSWGTKGMFEPSERLWRVWGLILNVILPLLPSCWGFSFAFFFF